MHHPIQSHYADLVAKGHLSQDPAQLHAARRLDLLSEQLAEAANSRKSFGLDWLFGSKKSTNRPKGLYIWGSVGRGKTMLMDMFFDSLAVERKRRTHFHTFMADVHERIHAWRELARAGHETGSDPIAPVAKDLADEAAILCFDEFTVTDIADAMILGRLFAALWRHEVVVIATSNVDPDLLYKNGLNRSLFLPFIALLKDNMDILQLDAAMDYRLEKLGGSKLYYTPVDAEANRAVDTLWDRLTGSAPRKPSSISVKSRTIEVPAASSGVARFEFGDLCAKPLGATDYLALARAYHTILIEDVPVMTLARRNEAKRFITLIDVLYENHVKLILSAAAEVDKLYRAEEGFEAFEFDRTVSRLIEMRSDDYLALPHGSKDSQDIGHTTGLVET